MTHKVDITRGKDATLPSFRKHMEELLDRYTKVHIVNLLKDDAQSTEYPLSQAYRSYVNSMPDLRDLLPFTSFDFHAIVGRGEYERVWFRPSAKMRNVSTSFY